MFFFLSLCCFVFSSGAERLFACHWSKAFSTVQPRQRFEIFLLFMRGQQGPRSRWKGLESADVARQSVSVDSEMVQLGLEG
jgi:hypothetical protein